MATKLEPDFPSPPPNDESDGEEQDDSNQTEGNDSNKKPVNNNVADILKRLQSSGALLKKPKQEYRCFTCDEDFRDWASLETHLIEHVSLPSVVVTKLPSDDEDAPSGDEAWSDEDDDQPQPPPTQKTPQKVDISQIMNKTGLVIKKPAQTENNSQSALNKLSGLGFTIKKSSTPIKEEKLDEDKVISNNDVMEKLGKLGGLKLKLKSDGGNKNSFSVVRGLKDFKTSDDEDEGSGNDDSKEEPGIESEGEQEKEASGGEQEDSGEDNANNEDEIPLANNKIVNALKNLQGTHIQMKVEAKSPVKPVVSTANVLPQPAKLPGRPAIKQTPKRGANLPMARPSPQPAGQGNISEASTPERRESNDKSNETIVVVKQEVDTTDTKSSNNNMPLFSGQIKSERESPPPTTTTSTPIITTVKSEPEGQIITSGEQPLFQNSTSPSTATTPLLPVTKTEDTGMTIIEINGDSNDEDDDCCVVSATPAPDVKPVIPKTEPLPYALPAFSTSQSNYSSDSILTSRLTGISTEKQHAFDWNAPDSKPPLDMLGKSADDIFESLLSSTKKENNLSLSDASEYISLDTLGPQHSCEVCNTRFTDISLLETHRRMTGHSQSLVIPASTSSNLMPYNPQSNILSTLLPVKQLAEQVGKLSTMGGSGPGFTHQQNVMINIQAYPGSGNVMGPPPPQYNSYPGQNQPYPNYSQPNNMYGAQGQPVPGHYPGQHYMSQPTFGSQYQPPMSKPDYSGVQSSLYSTASPLQGMQQAVYGQSQMGGMGPPGSSPNHPYVPASSPGGSMRTPNSSNVRIQDVQTFAPGQLGPVMGNSGQQMGQMGPPPVPNQPVGGQMPSPGPIRMAAGANMAGSRPRMPSVRGTRPSIRPGIQVHGQVRGAKPGVRMPMKRPGATTGGPGQKRRNDMLLPGKHDNEDCQVMAMQKQREGMPMIHSVQGAKDKLNLGSQISITKKTVNKEANAMANVLASRGISIKQKQKSRSPSPERPIPHIPNLGAGVSIKHTSKSSSFSIPEAKVGGGMLACRICKKMFMNQNSLSVHMSTAHPQSKVHMFKCDECPASYPKSLQLQHHRRVFHNATGANRELGLPVVDMSQEDNLKRLSNLGIYSFIPLANREQADGYFGIPVISVHNMQNGMISGLQALGADGLLSLGPLKPLLNS